MISVACLALASPGGAPMCAESLAAVRKLFSMSTHAEAVSFVDRVTAHPRSSNSFMGWAVRIRAHSPDVRSVSNSSTDSSVAFDFLAFI